MIDTSAPAETPSRKREREISQEPMTPSVESRPLFGGDSPSSPRPSSSRSSRPSPKKGRLFGPGSLDKTTEEEQQDLDSPETNGHGSGPTSVLAVVEEDNGVEHKMVILVSGSPPHETKMRQISEGVHGIEMKKADAGDDGRVITPTPFPTTEDSADKNKSANSEEPPTTLIDSVVPDVVQLETITSAAESPAVIDEPLPPLDRPKRASADYLLPFPGSRRGSDSSVEQEKGLKRKLGDRAVSESREAECVGKKASKKDVTDAATTCVAGTKRARDEEDKDPNPKEAKRPSPPPEKTAKKEAEEPPIASPPKMVGFMAYANIRPIMPPKEPLSSESTKRQREDADEDANPRETKRPSPPPDKDIIGDPKPTTSGGGFLAFASTKSPFASVKGPNVFGTSSTKTTAPPSPSPSPWSSGVRTPLTPSHDQTRPVFGSTSSPYVRPGSPGPAFGRSNSPSSRKLHTVGGINKSTTSAFSAYATNGFSGFSPTPKKTKAVEENGKKQEGSPDGSEKSDEEDTSEEKDGMSFGERLRSQKDDQGSGEDEKPVLTEQEVVTGEEEEETAYQVRGKLFALSEQNQWSERGTGLLKLNVRRTDGGGARLVMRKDAVYTVLLNTTLFKGMKCSYAPQDQRYLRFSTFDRAGAPTHYNLRLANARIAGELLDEIIAHIP
ncbi:hypothetical protein BDM02DRAFT_3186979 [Thelephora ganbajun]|uniref:Uncharacterized protein n=1 Tax=Thelephora ganbajun TaxID=370292 RepID=A0ACB6ZGF5_THEGA|nr:hypothetical protein BDM02DRAFT_3186979 [Thelephora ganbajun]